MADPARGGDHQLLPVAAELRRARRPTLTDAIRGPRKSRSNAAQVLGGGGRRIVAVAVEPPLAAARSEVEVVVADVIAPVAGLREERVADPGRAGGEVGGRRRRAPIALATATASRPHPGARLSIRYHGAPIHRRGSAGSPRPSRLAPRWARAPRRVLGRRAARSAASRSARSARSSAAPPCALGRSAARRSRAWSTRALDRPLEPLPGRVALELGPELGEALEEQLAPGRDARAASTSRPR